MVTVLQPDGQVAEPGARCELCYLPLAEALELVISLPELHETIQVHGGDPSGCL